MCEYCARYRLRLHSESKTASGNMSVSIPLLISPSGCLCVDVLMWCCEFVGVVGVTCVSTVLDTD